jgi:hypothetical protein
MSKTTRELMDEGEPPRKECLTTQMATAVTNAMITRSELLVLNGGGRYEKRESLELSLDRNIVLLSKLARKLQGEDLKTVSETLRDIRDHRRRLPRTDASKQDQAAHAQRILDEIPDV